MKVEGGRPGLPVPNSPYGLLWMNSKETPVLLCRPRPDITVPVDWA